MVNQLSDDTRQLCCRSRAAVPSRLVLKQQVLPLQPQDQSFCEYIPAASLVAAPGAHGALAAAAVAVVVAAAAAAAAVAAWAAAVAAAAAAAVASVAGPP